MKALIILGCEGRQQDGFHFCNGVENTILDLESINASPNFKELIKYLDVITGIFDSPCLNNNILSNTLYKIYEMGYVNDKFYKYIFHFYDTHKRCGLILKCIPKELKNDNPV